MIDFLFSFDTSMKQNFLSSLGKYRQELNGTQKIFLGNWGTLVTIGRAYPGFCPVETDKHIVVVLGGPLPRKDFTVANGEIEDDGTKWIIDHWKIKKDLIWDEDLVGHFLVVCIDKEMKCIEVVTDINSFVPVYEFKSKEQRIKYNITLGSHADALALATGQEKNIDPISIADFLTYNTVTFPYTLYCNIKELLPGSIISYNSSGQNFVDQYWVPKEKTCTMTFQQAAKELREIIKSNIERICAGQKRVGILMSGGEDSRAVATLIPKSVSTQAITFVDSINREAKIAEKVCKKLGIQWKPVIRTPTHYLDNAKSSLRLSESHNFFLHAHANGFVKYLPSEVRTLGALASDSFFKGHRIQGLKKWGITLKINTEKWQFVNQESINYFSSDLRKSLLERRLQRNTKLKLVRPNSWAEWHSLHPATMCTDFTYLIINRRIFSSYEPFCDAKVFKLSNEVPQSWKINRRLFHAAMKPIFKKTWFIPHGNGFFPYFGIKVNTPLLVYRAIKTKISKHLYQLGILSRPKNEGPWPEWADVVASLDFKKLYTELAEKIDTSLRKFVIMDESLNSPIQNLIQLHLLLWFSELNDSSDATGE